MSNIPSVNDMPIHEVKRDLIDQYGYDPVNVACARDEDLRRWLIFEHHVGERAVRLVMPGTITLDKRREIVYTIHVSNEVRTRRTDQ